MRRVSGAAARSIVENHFLHAVAILVTGLSASADASALGSPDEERNFLVQLSLWNKWWALLGLNQRPLACEANALPLS
jgi:hypothetical protein